MRTFLTSSATISFPRTLLNMVNGLNFDTMLYIQGLFNIKLHTLASNVAKYSRLYFPHCLKVKRNKLSQKLDTLTSCLWSGTSDCSLADLTSSSSSVLNISALHLHSTFYFPMFTIHGHFTKFLGTWQWGFTPHLAHMPCHLFYVKHHSWVVQIPASYHAVWYYIVTYQIYCQIELKL